MPAENRDLFKANGQVGPQFFDDSQDRYVPQKGRGGASYVSDAEVKAELELVKAELQAVKSILSSFIG